MLTPLNTADAINQAGRTFARCWKMLHCLTANPPSDPSPGSFHDFQPSLAEALFGLDELHRAIRHESNALIRRKNKVSPVWFERRQRQLSGLEKTLLDARSIGTALGDGFVWMFYHDERTHLQQHLRHEAVPHIPGGVGGLGELEFVRHTAVFQNHLVLYHGITTLLRLGDITFVDVDTFKIAAIGELKSSQEKAGVVSVRVHCVGPSALEVTKSLTPTGEPVVCRVPSKIIYRLRRQLKGIGESFTTGPARNLNAHTKSHADALEVLGRTLRHQPHAYQQCGDGLLLLGVTLDARRSLAGRMFCDVASVMTNSLGGLKEALLRILDPEEVKRSENFNRLLIGTLGVSLLPGTMPLAWWPIDPEFIRRILFREVVIVTFFNPTHLMRKLQTKGYDIAQSGDYHFTVSRSFPDAKAVVQGWDYFMRLISDNLISEDAVVGMVDQFVNGVREEKVPADRQIELDVMIRSM